DRHPLTLIVNDEGKAKTTLTESLEYNEFNEDGLYFTFIDFTKEFVWYPDSKSWRRRQQKTASSIGCKTFEDNRTVNKRLYLTFCLACSALGLLGNDREWHTALEESAFLAMSQQLRTLFAQILIICDVTDPVRLWKLF
nr:DNA helicase [Tanacetum cinerariifolium]